MFSIFKTRKPRFKPRMPEGVRAYAIGDIHGRLDCLNRVLDAIDRDPVAKDADETIEIMLGDYVDRGGESCQTLDLLIERQKDKGSILLKGNHEEVFLNAIDDPSVLNDWLRIGGLETINSYGVPIRLPLDYERLDSMHRQWQDRVPENHLSFLASLELSHDLGDYFFVHAGIKPGRALDQQIASDMLWIRDEFLASTRNHGKMIVHGHTPVERPETLANRINLDTGAYITNHLTCFWFEADKCGQL